MVTKDCIYLCLNDLACIGNSWASYQSNEMLGICNLYYKIYQQAD